MKPIPHLVLSCGVGAGIYALTRSWQMTFSSTITGTLIDVDHLPDYVREYPANWSIRHFLKVFEKTRFRRVTIVLHGWEWLGVLTIMAAAYGWPSLITGVILGGLHHLAADQLFNKSRPGTYFFFWRLARGFRAGEIFPGAES